MSFFQRLFRPAHSLILVYDHVTPDNEDEISIQLDEISRFYRFVPLSELSQAERRRRQSGVASVVFREPRRSVTLRAIPLLRDRGIPYTLMLDPLTVGTNRLSFVDEIELYNLHFFSRHASGPDVSSVEWSPTELLASHFRDAVLARQTFSKIREKLGPLPFDQLDPTFFSATWGQLLELPRDEVEFGLSLDRDSHQSEVGRDLDFVRKQVERPITAALLRVDYPVDFDSLLALGVRSLVVNRVGTVSRNTPSLNLPQFQFEKA